MLSAANAGTAQARHRSPAVHATSYGDHLLPPPPAPGGLPVQVSTVELAGWAWEFGLLGNCATCGRDDRPAQDGELVPDCWHVRGVDACPVLSVHGHQLGYAARPNKLLCQQLRLPEAARLGHVRVQLPGEHAGEPWVNPAGIPCRLLAPP